ncbi:uncharacterized protein N7469_002231 [Penicillium citrinum]|uniref:Aminoacyl-tRNA synthetase class II (D/K/N) domain-containing protein n=1 Tax=Penicillium citrinum TaxID=5077 RepID=A0A9W9TTB6_PENCI|nr:uncharacterized protein N7469_002231 [Penicillium citrinum]KAJ5240640.1 hypothetical protein N7469_002231 [Penicillium citrinum]
MAISADFGRVYGIEGVFRAEDSNTHHHLTEYTELDIEIVTKVHDHEMLEVLDEILKDFFLRLHHDYCQDIEIVHETPNLKFSDAVQLLDSSGRCDEDGGELKGHEDLNTRDEIRLGQLVKKNILR